VRSFPVLAVAAFIAALSAPNASAYLWETQAQIEKRYGLPVKITGYPDRRAFTYAVEDLIIKVKFLDGVSAEETYSPSAGGVAFGDSEVRRLLKANGRGGKWRQQARGEWVIETPKGRAHTHNYPELSLVVCTRESVERDPANDSIDRTGKEETFEGVAAVKQEDKTTSVTVHSGGFVVYLPWSDGWRDRGLRGLFRSGKTYRIILRDEWVWDDDEPWAFVSDRDHKDYHATVNDSKCYVLMRVEEGGAVIFDRSVCEVHHVKMSEITAKIRDRTSATPPGEEECESKFPHYRDFLKIMCLGDGTERASLYVCPECVAACKRLTDSNR
jgi:hypothetical protein